MAISGLGQFVSSRHRSCARPLHHVQWRVQKAGSLSAVCRHPWPYCFQSEVLYRRSQPVTADGTLSNDQQPLSRHLHHRQTCLPSLVVEKNVASARKQFMPRRGLKLEIFLFTSSASSAITAKCLSTYKTMHKQRDNCIVRNITKMRLLLKIHRHQSYNSSPVQEKTTEC